VIKHSGRSALICIICCFCLAAFSFAADLKRVEIPAGDLSVALQSLTKQTGIELVYQTEAITGVRTKGVSGTLPPVDALTKLLEGTGLKLNTDSTGAMLIAAPQAASHGSSNPNSPPTGSSDDASKLKETGNKNSQDFRVAQVDQGVAGPQVASDDLNSDKKKKKEEGLSEIVVTGSRIPTAPGQQTVPVRSYTREDVARSGQSTMGEFLNTLPDVSNFTQSAAQLGVAGEQTVRLHGLPIGTTVSLLDGRRVETNSQGLFDLGNIPVSAVERIEILPVGASAIYGADALGGAVNIILRKDFEGFEVNGTLDHAAGVNDPGVNLAWGKRWERGSVSLISSYEARDELSGSQREPLSLTAVPAAIPKAPVTDSCAPGNVYSLDGSNLPGLSSSHAAIPAGISGIPTTAQFAATAGRSNACNLERYIDITPRSRREGALLSAHYQLAEQADLFGEILLSHRTVQNLAQGAGISTVSAFGGILPATNAYNPFGEDVGLSFTYPGPPMEIQSASLIRPTVGVRGTFSSNWHYEATATYARDRLHDASGFYDFIKIPAALASSDPATALNPFASGAPGTPQLLKSLHDPAVDTIDTLLDDQIRTIQVLLRGPLLPLPAGALQAVFGGEYAQERQATDFSFPIFAVASQVSLHRNTFAGFGEARVPLLATGETSQREERLVLTLAGRYDHSDDFGGKATWQGGLLWHPTHALSFNASYGQSYKAPDLLSISGAQSTSRAGLFATDPFRGNEAVSYDVNTVSGGNPNLKPQTGTSTALGVAYSDAPTGLQASLTWYSLRISNYIGTQLPQEILDHPELFPGAVVRAPPTALDQQQGFLGKIVTFNSVAYNFGDLNVKGVDADVKYIIDSPVGEITPSLAVANIYNWESALIPGAQAVDAVSKANLFGTGWAPRWKGTVGLAWKRGPYSMNVADRYLGRYLDYQEFSPNTHETGNTWITDASVRCDVGKALGSKYAAIERSFVSLSAVNVFNKTPPFTNTAAWYDYNEYDARGRFLHLNVGLRF
jgi:iron complex outermembrane receptor protein